MEVRHVPPDQVFCLRGADGLPEWHALMNGQIIGAAWRDQGTAIAGLAVEQRRHATREKIKHAHGQ